MSFSNLKAEFARLGIKHQEVADYLEMSLSNFSKKMAEKIPVTRDEMFAIQRRFFPQASLEYLFASDGDTPTKAESLHAQVSAMGDAMRQSAGEDPEIAEIEGLFHEAVDEWERQAGE